MEWFSQASTEDEKDRYCDYISCHCVNYMYVLS